jgi:hypothetical protein
MKRTSDTVVAEGIRSDPDTFNEAILGHVNNTMEIITD